MIKIKQECQANATRMLEVHGQMLGHFNDTRYFLFDGKAWLSHVNGQVARSDDDEETEDIRRTLLVFKELGAKTYKLFAPK